MTRLGQVSIWTTSLQFVTNVPNRRNTRWNHERNGDGYGSIEIPALDDVITRYPQIVTDDGYLVQLTKAGQDSPFFGFLVEKPSEVIASEEEGGGRWIRLEGRGPRAVLQGTVLFPENQGAGQPFDLRDTTGDQRPTSFASFVGPWKVIADWDAPLGQQQSTDTTGTRGGSGGDYPLSWPDGLAQWIWSTDPTATATVGINWFRGDLVLASETSLGIWASGDNRILELYVDGDLVHQDSPDELYGWKNTVFVPITLPPGTHTIAAAVENRSGPGGFLCTIGTLNTAGDLSAVLLRTNTTDWQVRGYGDPPGWLLGQVYVKFVQDSQLRDEIPGVTLTFDSVNDSRGDPWPDPPRINRSWPVGADLLDVLQQLIERGVDADMSANLNLSIWNRMGTDRTGAGAAVQVKLSPTVNILRDEPASDRTQLRNRVLVRWGDRSWVLVEDAASILEFGPRSISITAGDASSATEASDVGQSYLRDHAWPVNTHAISITNLHGPQPYEHFWLDDDLMAKTLLGTFTAQQVIGIGGKELEDQIIWDIAMDEEP